MKFGVGVLGATGFIGTPYRDEIRDCPDDVRIVALCARRADRLAAAAETDGATLVTHDWRELVEHRDVNLVLVATPDTLHHEAVMACAAADKHIICEKPAGMNAAEAEEMWDVYRDADLAHFVPFWTRYVPAFVRARQIVRAGELGDIRVVLYRWHNPRPATMPFTWRDDAQLSAAGSIADVGSHAYDTVRWILGRQATRVLAHGDVISPPKPNLGAIDLGEAINWGQAHATTQEADSFKKGTAFDYASVIWQFENGAVGSLVLSHAPTLRKGFAPELELHGTSGSLGVDRLNSRLMVARTEQPAEVFEAIPDTGFGNRFSKHVFPALRQQIQGAPSDHPNLEDAFRVQLFTDAVVASTRCQTWVDV